MQNHESKLPRSVSISQSVSRKLSSQSVSLILSQYLSISLSQSVSLSQSHSLNRSSQSASLNQPLSLFSKATFLTLGTVFLHLLCIPGALRVSDARPPEVHKIAEPRFETPSFSQYLSVNLPQAIISISLAHSLAVSLNQSLAVSIAQSGSLAQSILPVNFSQSASLVVQHSNVSHTRYCVSPSTLHPRSTACKRRAPPRGP